MKEKIIRYVKLLWVLCIIFFLAYYLLKQWDYVVLTINLLPLGFLVVSLLFVCLGKVGLAKNMQYALKRVNVNLPFIECFRIYSITQIPKYIPGSLWQFVGRGGYYLDLGIKNSAIRKSIFIEVLWTLSGAFVLGILTVVLFNQSLGSSIFSLFSTRLFLLIVLVLILFFIIVTFIIANRRFSVIALLKNYLPTFQVVTVQFGIWFFLGSSFTVILAHFTGFSEALIYFIGLYALAYGVGFLAVFAPAGIGIRESVLVLGLTGWIAPEQALIIAGLHRIIYFFADVTLAGISIVWQWKRRSINCVDRSSSH